MQRAGIAGRRHGDQRPAAAELGRQGAPIGQRLDLLLMRGVVRLQVQRQAKRRDLDFGAIDQPPGLLRATRLHLFGEIDDIDIDRFEAERHGQLDLLVLRRPKTEGIGAEIAKHEELRMVVGQATDSELQEEKPPRARRSQSKKDVSLCDLGALRG